MRNIYKIVCQQFLRLFSDWKFWLAIILGVTVSFNNLSGFKDYFEKVVSATNVYEPFVYLGSNNRGFLCIFIGALLMISEAPFKNCDSALEIVRVGKKNWFISRVIFTFCVCVFYSLIILFSTIIYFSCTWYTYTDNLWSPGMTFLVENQPQFAISKYGLLFPFSGMIHEISPCIAALLTVLCSSIYAFIIGLIITIVNVISSRNYGWIVASFIHIVFYILFVGGAFSFPFEFSPLMWAMPAYYFEGHSLVTSIILTIGFIYFLLDSSLIMIRNREL